MKHVVSLLFVAAAHAAVLPRQAGGFVASLPAGTLESVGDGLSTTAAALSGEIPKMARREPRQAVGDIGGIVAGALDSLGAGLQSTGKGFEGSVATALPGQIMESIGSGLISAAQSAKGATGNPRLVANVVERQVPGPADTVASVGSGLKDGAAAAGGLGSGIVGQVGKGLEEGAKGAKDGAKGPKMLRRLPTSGSPVSPMLGSRKNKRQTSPTSTTAADALGSIVQGASGITEAVADGLKSSPLTAPAGAIVEGVSSGLSAAAPKSPKLQKNRRQTSSTSTAADALGSVVQGASGITEAVADGLKSSPLTAPAGAIVEGVSSGLSAAAGSAKGPKLQKSRRQTAPTGTTAADAIGGAVQGAGGITGAVADGLKSSPLTAPAGAIVEGVSSGLSSAGGSAKGPKSQKRM